jgi:hypothetical protein
MRKVVCSSRREALGLMYQPATYFGDAVEAARIATGKGWIPTKGECCCIFQIRVLQGPARCRIQVERRQTIFQEQGVHV